MKPALASLLIGGLLLATPNSASATTGGSCFQVMNVPSWDVLNIRARPSATSQIVGTIDPGHHGIIGLQGTCVPKSASLPRRWCPIVHVTDSGSTRGYVKRRYLSPSECP